MRLVPKKRPRSAFVEPKLGEDRTERMWTRIESRSFGSRVPSRTAWLAAATLAAALLLLVWGVRRSETIALEIPPAPAGSAPSGVISTDEGNQVLAFGDGTSLSLGPHTRVTVIEANGPGTRARLEQGTVLCDVRASALTLEAGDAVVVLEPGAHEVRVDAGQRLQVEARTGSASLRGADGGLMAALQPGQLWSELGVAQTAGWVSSEAPVVPSSHGKVSAPPTSVAPRAENGVDADVDAQQIFARGESARLAGRDVDAANAFEQLVGDYPSDRRAAIAALEAGRLRLRAGNAARALTDFAFAKSHAAEPFREDAHAGLVEALSARTQTETCQRARDEFLARYPSSPHRDKVSTRCP